MTADAPSDRGRGWIAVAALLLVMTIIHGTITSALPAFDKAMLAEFGISRGALKAREAIFFMSTGLSGLLVGFVATWFEPRRIMLFGLVLLSATLWTYGHAQTIGQVYVLYLFLGLSYACAHVVVVVLTVRARFVTKQALATSIALSGTSIGAAIYPGMGTLLLQLGGWREALQWLALVPLAAFPVAYLLLRDTRPRGSARTITVEPDGSTHRSPLRLALLMISTFGILFASTSFLMNMFLFLQDSGLAPGMASAGISVFFVAGLIAKPIVGLAAERWGRLPVWSWQNGILLAGAITITFGSGPAILLGLILFGVGWAGCFVLTQVVISDYFAGPKLGRLLGAFIVFEAVASGTGVWSAGAMFDHFGSYRVAFTINCACIVTALFVGLAFRRSDRGGRQTALQECAAF